MEKPPLRLSFTDTYDNAKKFWVWALGTRYDVSVVDQDTDLLIFGDQNFGSDHLSQKWNITKKLFFTGENVRATWTECDYSCDFDYNFNVPEKLHRFHYRLPLYVLEMWAYMDQHGYAFDYLYNRHEGVDLEKEYDIKTRFCSFIQSNPNVEVRNQVFHWLNSVQRVDSGGPLFNNMGYVVDRPGGHMSKHDFIKTRKFNLAFENGSHIGYTTEKLLNAFYANVIPIYYGNPEVVLDFNKEAFINVHDFVGNDGRINGDALLNSIAILNLHKGMYLDMMSKTVFNSNNTSTDIMKLTDWFHENVYKEIM